MKLIFVRHGEGEHTKDSPSSLQVPHPPLTDEGRNQAKLLQCNVPLQETDILIASPTIRTLQTATIWSAKVACQNCPSICIPTYFSLSRRSDNITM